MRCDATVNVESNASHSRPVALSFKQSLDRLWVYPNLRIRDREPQQARYRSNSHQQDAPLTTDWLGLSDAVCLSRLLGIRAREGRGALLADGALVQRIVDSIARTVAELP